jgi:hypothetical protein
MQQSRIQQLITSSNWQNYLKTQSRFHRYSFNNTVLILMQLPDATKVAGFNTWKQLQRCVNKGEKAISILAPLRYKQEVEDPKTGDTTQQFGIRGFKKVSVFDISQTSGQDLLEPPVSPLHGDDQGLFKQLQHFSDHRGWSVKVEPLGGANGVCRFGTRQIGIDPKLSPLHRAKTLAHEIAHSLLHEEAQYNEHRGDLELEAESVAFIVLDHFGLDSGDYSFGYVASWQTDKDAIAQLQKVGQRIQGAAKQIIDTLELSQSSSELEYQLVA